MKIITAAEIASTLDYASLIDAIDQAFKVGATIPARAHHSIDVKNGRDSTLLLMPAWDDGDYLGVKIVCAVPDNAARGLPAVQATYQLFDRLTGQPLALLNGPELTARRTASASALAAKYLARTDSRTLLVVGTGVLSPHLVRAHMVHHPIENIKIWGRNFEKSTTVKQQLLNSGLQAKNITAIEPDRLQNAVMEADIISTATLSLNPLINGRWLRPGQHLDLVGGFTPHMREADDECIKRAGVFLDTPQAMVEAGDICQPLATGVLEKTNIKGTLFDLARHDISRRTADNQITLFKSTGTALEDLAAAKLSYLRILKENQ